LRLQRIVGLIAPTLVVGALAALPAAAHPGNGKGHAGDTSGTAVTTTTATTATGGGTSSVSNSSAGSPSNGSGAGATTSTAVPDTDSAVCGANVPAGYARCNAHVRTDSNARGHAPAQPGMEKAHPNVVGNGGAYDPRYLQSAYSDPAYAASSTAGAGQIVAIVDAFDDPAVGSDLAYYRTYFGLPTCATPAPPAPGQQISATSSCAFYKVDQSGGTSYPSADSGWAQEISLDVDMVSAMCPDCTIVLVEANDNSMANLGQSVNEAVSLGASVVSNSYGASEYGTENSDSLAYYTHPGVAVVASSGDNGYGVEFPAASPTVTSVGGTTLTQSTNTGTRNATESAWSGAGSGCSAVEAKPSYQHDSGCSRRTVADVSAVANPSTGVWVYDQGWYVFGGTSVASPIIGSMFALGGALNGTGSATPAQWPYGNAAALNDVTSGSNGSCSVSYLCRAVTGYDGPTGLGTPNGTGSFNGTAAQLPGAPAAPTGLTATGGTARVNLNWTAPATSAGHGPASSYIVLRSTTPGGETKLVSGVTSTSYTDASVTNGKTYYYQVEAVSSGGTSGVSNEASASPLGSPGAPSSLTAAAASPPHGVTMTWKVGTNASTTYKIYRGTRSGKYSSVTTVTVSCSTSAGATCTFSDTTTSPGTNYYYRVAAVNGAGTSSQSNQAGPARAS
jgi:subtilase family serine protease